MNQYKLIGLDLDGTLTQHKTHLEKGNSDYLYELAKRYNCIMIGAGSCQRIYEQMNGFPIEIIGNYGMQRSVIDNGCLKLVKNDSYAADRDFFDKTVADLRILTGYTKYVGKSVEYHQSGAVTFPLLGTDADINDKLCFDPSGEKRRAIYDLVAEKFKDFNCFVGGSSSFDIVKKEYDKYKAIMEYAAINNISKNEILFIGDDFEKGGNDEQVKLGGIDCIRINDYKRFGQLLKERMILG